MAVLKTCGSFEHVMARRQFLGGVAAGAIASGLGVLARPALAGKLQKDQKRVAVFNLLGGSSQLETWDPKPGTDTGGPFLSIPTSVPGIQISELMPMTARQMHHLCLVRGLNTSEDDHAKGRFYMMSGRRESPGESHPEMGAVMAKALSPENSLMPGNIAIRPGGGHRSNDAAYLGPEFATLYLGDGAPPMTTRPEAVSEVADQSRNDFRQFANSHFMNRRRSAMTEAYTYSYEQAQALMQKRDAFDISFESERDRERYGNSNIGRHTLMARRLLEQGVTYTQVWHMNYDTHNENFNFHAELIPEFDRAFACFVEDIVERGMLDSTIIAVVSEFGRTPNINTLVGRDHFSAAWSVCLGGGGIARGAVHGSTNENGTQVVDGQVDAANLFHTYLQAAGVDSLGSFNVGGREFPLADPASHPIAEILA